MLSHVRLLVTAWTIACQAPLSMKLSRQEYWSRLLFLFLFTPGLNLHLLCLLQAAPRLRSGVVTKTSYPTPEVRRGSCEEIPLVQGKEQ